MSYAVSYFAAREPRFGMVNREFYRMLRQRNLTLLKVAAMAKAGHSSVKNAVTGLRPSVRTWDRLKSVLTAEEYECAKRFADAKLAGAEQFEHAGIDSQ